MPAESEQVLPDTNEKSERLVSLSEAHVVGKQNAWPSGSLGV